MNGLNDTYEVKYKMVMMLELEMWILGGRDLVMFWSLSEQTGVLVVLVGSD